jgi:hypothetical protein
VGNIYTTILKLYNRPSAAIADSIAWLFYCGLKKEIKI